MRVLTTDVRDGDQVVPDRTDHRHQRYWAWSGRLSTEEVRLDISE